MMGSKPWRCTVIVIAIGIALSAAQAPHKWVTYRNARFGTTALYPADLFRDALYPDNGDGVRLTSSHGAALLIYGEWNALDHTPASLAKFLREADPQYRHVTYRVVKPKLLILSGADGGKIFYERHTFGDPSGAIHTVSLEYPVQYRAIYDPLVPRIAASLRWTRPAGG